MRDDRGWSAAAERNKAPILEVLRRVFPSAGRVLEIACGTGQHAAHFAAALPGLQWQPTDVSEAALASARAWVEASGLPNLRAPRRLDVTRWPSDLAGPEAPVDAIFNANMVHISPWAVTLGLLDGASRGLSEGGVLAMYGPYKVGGKHTASSNAAFDESLRRRDPSWGVRDLDRVIAEAAERGLRHVETVLMPANNLTVVYEKR